MWVSLPNILSLTRVAVLPIIVTLLWPGIESPHTCFWAMIVYAVAGITDIFDGMLARRINQVTVLGKFLDPLTDKLFYLITLVALLQLPGPWVPAWLVMMVLTREFSITGLRAMAASEGIVIAAEKGGKIKTIFGTVGMCGLLIHYTYPIHIGFWSGLVDFYTTGLWITFISVLYSLTSGVKYARDFIRALQTRSTSGE